MRASTAFARGVLAAAESDHRTARRHLEDAVDTFDQAGAPFEAACARLELARVMAALDRKDLAAQEARTAHSALLSMGAGLEARRAAGALDSLGIAVTTRRSASEPRWGLSRREVEVLRLVAQGLSNRGIAEALVLSEHTVRRHVANILHKTGVPSRAAAATLAARHELL